MVQALVPVKIHNNLNIAKRYTSVHAKWGGKQLGTEEKKQHFTLTIMR